MTQPRIETRSPGLWPNIKIIKMKGTKRKTKQKRQQHVAIKRKTEKKKNNNDERNKKNKKTTYSDIT